MGVPVIEAMTASSVAVVSDNVHSPVPHWPTEKKTAGTASTGTSAAPAEGCEYAGSDG